MTQPTPVPGAAVRAAAARAIATVRFDGASLKATLPNALSGLSDARDRALCEAIAFEACRFALRYERWFDALLPRARPPRPIQALLLSGLAQLEAMRLPDYAAIASTAEAARTLRQPRFVGLVNAVLRRYARERDAFDAAAQRDPVARLAHPPWLIDAVRRDWDDEAEAILAQNNHIAPLWLRINRRRASREPYAEALAAAGLTAQSSQCAPDALRLDDGVSAARLPGWDDGQVSVQDLSAQLCALSLNAQPGDRVLDACAAPGGKAAHLLEGTDLSELVALDVDATRLARVQETLTRLRLSATLRAADATAPDTWWDGHAFDRILLDAPCSGTGVIRRQPDIKLHRRAADVPPLLAVQARLLQALWPLLRPGGRLVYATCSVLRDENERQIDAFIARQHDVQVVALAEVFGRPCGAGRQRLPGEHGGDGFFYAALEKRA